MIVALATGWLPGPGGIPLFILGLSLLAINHEWAQRYIDLLKKHANSLGDKIFVNNHKLQLLYDLIAPIVIFCGVFLILNHSALWKITLGIFGIFAGFTLLLGNRQRWKRLKNKLK